MRAIAQALLLPRRKSGLVALAAAVLAFSAAGASALPSAAHAATPASPRVSFPSDGSPLHVTFYGDSVGSRGSLASSVERTWQAEVVSSLAAVGPVAPYRRVSGVHDAAGNTTAASLRETDTVAGDDVTFVMLGTNDVREGTSLATFRSEYRHDLDLLESASPSTDLVCGGVWQPAGQLQATYDGVIAEACAARHGTFLGFSDIYGAPASRLPVGVQAFPTYWTDGFHPGDAGQYLIYRRYAAALALPVLPLPSRVTPEAPTPVAIAPGVGSVRVTWALPTSDGTSARIGFRVTVTDGTNEIKHINVSPTWTAATVTGLPAGVPLRAIVTPFNHSGAGLAARSGRLAGVALTRAATATTVHSGQAVTVSGRLTVAGTATGLTGRNLRLYRSPVGGTTWSSVASTTTYTAGTTAGRYLFHISPTATYRYRVVFSGATGYEGVATTPIQVAVA